MDKWTKKIPKDNGWYWISYKRKTTVGNGKVKSFTCPCNVLHNDKLTTITTHYNDILLGENDNLQPFNGQKLKSVRFGNPIPQPNCTN